MALGIGHGFLPCFRDTVCYLFCWMSAVLLLDATLGQRARAKGPPIGHVSSASRAQPGSALRVSGRGGALLGTFGPTRTRLTDALLAVVILSVILRTYVQQVERSLDEWRTRIDELTIQLWPTAKSETRPTSVSTLRELSTWLLDPTSLK